jgi:uncharacterized protein (TIGR02246 family)
MTPITTDTTISVAAVVEQMEQAWNRADGAGFAAVFTDDADFVNIRGEHIEGRVAISHGHQGIFDTIYAGSTNRLQLGRVRQIAPETILAVVSSTLDAPTGPLRGVHQACFTMTLVEHDDRWEVAAFHNTLVVQPG